MNDASNRDPLLRTAEAFERLAPWPRSSGLEEACQHATSAIPACYRRKSIELRVDSADAPAALLTGRRWSASLVAGPIRSAASPSQSGHVSPDLVSAVTDAVLEEVALWQNRPLEPAYPLVFFGESGCGECGAWLAPTWLVEEKLQVKAVLIL
jgi:hypothetical protein